MQTDPLVESMRKNGQVFMARYANNVAKACAALKEKEQYLNCHVVNHQVQ